MLANFRCVANFRYASEFSLHSELYSLQAVAGLIFGALCTILSFMIYIYIYIYIYI